MEIGSIVGAQGLRGEVKVVPNSDFPERFERAGERWLWDNGSKEPRSIKLERGYRANGKNLYIIKLAGIDDRNRAEELRGAMLILPQSDRPKLPADEYHSQDLIGATVFHQATGQEIGTVTDIFTTGHDILVIQSADGKEILMPFVMEIVPLVDITARRIEVLPPNGLLELYGA
jgi:16S rRNA processing protein RimM